MSHHFHSFQFAYLSPLYAHSFASSPHFQAAKQATSKPKAKDPAPKRSRKRNRDSDSDDEASDDGFDITPPSDSDDSEDDAEDPADKEWDIDRIVSGPNAEGLYEVRWEGFDDSSNTWEPESNLPHNVISEFLLTSSVPDGDCDDADSNDEDDDTPLAQLLS